MTVDSLVEMAGRAALDRGPTCATNARRRYCCSFRATRPATDAHQSSTLSLSQAAVGGTQMYSLTSFKSLSIRGFRVPRSRTRLAVAKPEVDRRSAAGELRSPSPRTPPRREDLVQPLSSSSGRPSLRRARRLRFKQSAARSSWPRFSKIDARALGSRLFAVTGPGIIGDCLVDLDRVEFVGKLEPLDRRSRAGRRFRRPQGRPTHTGWTLLERFSNASPTYTVSPRSSCVPNSGSSRKLA